jgi:hypothetical protein
MQNWLLVLDSHNLVADDLEKKCITHGCQVLTCTKEVTKTARFQRRAGLGPGGPMNSGEARSRSGGAVRSYMRIHIFEMGSQGATKSLPSTWWFGYKLAIGQIYLDLWWRHL